MNGSCLWVLTARSAFYCQSPSKDGGKQVGFQGEAAAKADIKLSNKGCCANLNVCK